VVHPFNVIAGAMAIPTDLKEAARIFKFSSMDRWRYLILPGIFPYLVTGMVTASGGAWNASIVAEYFTFRENREAPGLEHDQQRQRRGPFDLLLASTLIMAVIVVLITGCCGESFIAWRRRDSSWKRSLTYCEAFYPINNRPT